MDQNIEDNLNMKKDMVMEIYLLLMEENTKENSKMEIKMDKEY